MIRCQTTAESEPLATRRFQGLSQYVCRSTGVCRGRCGPKRQLDVEARDRDLLAVGVGTVEACQAVGITPKTGYWWRSGGCGLAPLELPETARSNRYLPTRRSGAAESHPARPEARGP